MKKNYFLSFFITLHIILIFLQIHKHTLFIENSYTIQEYEKKIATLIEKKQMLNQELHALKDREAIKKYAHNTLGMRPYTLKQIKKIDHDSSY